MSVALPGVWSRPVASVITTLVLSRENLGPGPRTGSVSGRPGVLIEPSGVPTGPSISGVTSGVPVVRRDQLATGGRKGIRSPGSGPSPRPGEPLTGPGRGPITPAGGRLTTAGIAFFLQISTNGGTIEHE